MRHVVVIGCGVVGATIAYELSLVPGLSVTVLDKQPPAQGATCAALGVLMALLIHKVKGKPWQMRQTSIQRYETLIPELEAITGRKIPYNRQGILLLCAESEDLEGWQRLVDIRHSQGFKLEFLAHAEAKSKFSYLNSEQFTAAVYSPQDRQVDPVILTLNLVEAAQRNGVKFHFGVTVEEYCLNNLGDRTVCRQIKTKAIEEANQPGPTIENVDWLVISAGLGSLSSLQGIDNWKIERNSQLKQKIQLDIRPVLGQAIHLKLPQPLGDRNFQPVITADDVHIVPVGNTNAPTDNNIYPTEWEYWVGATLEYPTDTGDVFADETYLDALMEKAIGFCPDLTQATIVRTWSGLRPRPEAKAAPIIGNLPGYSNVLLATGHYRNGVLLAPATAYAIRDAILREERESLHNSPYIM